MLRDRFRAPLVAMVVVSLLLDLVLTLIGVGRFNEGNPLIAWLYLRIGYVGVVTYFVCAGLLYALILCKCDWRLAFIVAFVAWYMHALGAATWLLHTSIVPNGRAAQALLATVVLASAFFVALAMEPHRPSPPATARHRSRSSRSAAELPYRDATMQRADAFSATQCRGSTTSGQNTSKLSQGSLSERAKTSLLLFLSSSYGLDLIVTGVYLMNHSTENPVLDWLDFQFGIAGTLLYFACLGSVYWHAVRLLPHKLMIVTIMSAWFAHLTNVSTHVFGPIAEIGPGMAYLLLVSVSLVASVFLVLARNTRTAT
jgi:hypothetical protein